MVRPNGVRSHPPRQMVGLEGHYKSQGLGVPDRRVSPFSDLPATSFSASGSYMILGSTSKHGPNYPRVRVRDRNHSPVVTSSLPKFVYPTTTGVRLPCCCPDDGASSMNKQRPQMLVAPFADAHHQTT